LKGSISRTIKARKVRLSSIDALYHQVSILMTETCRRDISMAAEAENQWSSEKNMKKATKA
jgi:hypothetical protein